MSTWHGATLAAATAHDEVQVLTSRRDGTLRRPRTIWIVAVGDRAFVRSKNGRDAAWFRGAVATGNGRLIVGGRGYDVTFREADRQDLPTVDASPATGPSTGVTRPSSSISSGRAPGPRPSSSRPPEPTTPEENRHARHRHLRSRGHSRRGPTRPVDPRTQRRRRSAPSPPASAGPTSGGTEGSPRPQPTPIGHEYVGVVEAVGDEVRTVPTGSVRRRRLPRQRTTPARCAGWVHAHCTTSAGFDGCQAEAIRIPHADGTLLATPEQPDDAMVPEAARALRRHATGWHAAVSADVRPGSTVVVVGDGAVGLSGVLSA